MTELLEVFDAEIVAAQMQQGIDQHGTMAIGQHEAVTVGPLWVSRIMLKVIVPQHFGDIRHAHRGARVARLGFLHCIHAQGTDTIGKISAV